MTIISRIGRALTDEQVRRPWVDWTQVFANLCVPISILVAILVFSAQRQDQKVQLDSQIAAQEAQDRRATAIQYVMLKHQDGFLQPAAKINSAFAQPQILELFADLRGAARRELFEERTNRVGLSNFEKMANLYRAVLACRKAKACDAGIIDAAYRVEITQFYCLSREYALPELVKKLNDPEYSAPLADYAQDCRSNPPIAGHASTLPVNPD